VTPPVFGTLIPCPECHGAGEVRHRKDPQAARERARLRARGQLVAEPPSMDPCGRCGARGYLPPETSSEAPPDWMSGEPHD
jgi:hypothetical protein